MPKRTNHRQRIIEVLKALTAPTGSVVTASKILTDTLGVAREVDVVVETIVGGQAFVQSFEVVARSRPMDITWIEQVIGKHATLPTDRLFLVSWSGFTPDAFRRAVATPKVIPVIVGGQDGAVTLQIDQANLSLKVAIPKVSLPSGVVSLGPAPQDLAIHSSSGDVRGSIWELGTWLLRSDAGRSILEAARVDPEGGKRKWFELNVPLKEPPLDGLFLRDQATEDLQKFVELNLQGEFGFSRRPLALELRSFAESPFGHAKAEIGGEDHLVVASLDPTLNVLSVRVERLTDERPS